MKKINFNVLAHLLAPVIATLILGACSSVPIETTDKTATYADKDLSYTPLGKMETQLEAGKPENESGFLLLDRGHDARERVFAGPDECRQHVFHAAAQQCLRQYVCGLW